MSPRIMNVAVRCSQHSPMFGQRALSHTVCRSSVRMMRSKSRKFWPPENRTRNQGGRAGFAAIGAEFGRMLNGVAIEFGFAKHLTRTEHARQLPARTRVRGPRAWAA